MGLQNMPNDDSWELRCMVGSCQWSGDLLVQGLISSMLGAKEYSFPEIGTCVYHAVGHDKNSML
jgi:hypothetical protein